jgi:aminomethyltransferase
VAWDKPEFIGRDAAIAERTNGIERRLAGIVTEGRRPARAGCAVSLDAAGSPVGEITSGNFSPVLGHGIALAFLPPDIAEGTAVTVDVRGKQLVGRVAATPFVGR